MSIQQTEARRHSGVKLVWLNKLHPISKTQRWPNDLLKNELTLLPANLTHSELNSMLRTEDFLEPEIPMTLHSIEYLQSLQVKGGHCQFYCNKMSRQHRRQGLPCWKSLLFIAMLMTELAKMHRASQGGWSFVSWEICTTKACNKDHGIAIESI
jgi:hypothetical protein